nr:DUF3817 domain-containing protein [Leifsonia sp. Leaf325]
MTDATGSPGPISTPAPAPGRGFAATPQRYFRVVAIAEAITWTLLIAGMLQKYVFDAGEWGVSLGGGLHGFVFIAYAASVVLVAVNQRWSLGVAAAGIASAVVPYATIPFDLWADRTGRLDGPWRRETDGHPSDGSVANRLLRWGLARPVLVAVLAVVAVALVFGALLLIGPPGGRD